MNTKTKLFQIETLITFKNTYVVEARNLEDAYDEVSLIESGSSSDAFEPINQLALPEQIMNGYEITKKDFDEQIKIMEKNDSGSYWMGDMLIRKVDYEKTC